VVKARFFNSYGPGEVPGQYRNVIPNFIYWAMKGLPLPITGDGTETRDFTFVGDITDGLLRAGVVEAAIGEEFNLASGRETRIVDLATWINEAVGNPAGINFAPRRIWDTKRRLCASVDKARVTSSATRPTPSSRRASPRPSSGSATTGTASTRPPAFGPGISSAVRQMTVQAEPSR
jgi:UDP-glucose 4-epimerase